MPMDYSKPPVQARTTTPSTSTHPSEMSTLGTVTQALKEAHDLAEELIRAVEHLTGRSDVNDPGHSGKITSPPLPQDAGTFNILHNQAMVAREKMFEAQSRLNGLWTHI